MLVVLGYVGRDYILNLKGQSFGTQSHLYVNDAKHTFKSLHIFKWYVIEKASGYMPILKLIFLDEEFMLVV